MNQQTKLQINAGAAAVKAEIKTDKATSFILSVESFLVGLFK